MSDQRPSPLLARLQPYRDIICFAVCLLAANYFWKFTVDGDEGTNVVMWFGLNITAPFEWLSEHIARVAYRLTQLVVPNVTFTPPYTIAFESGFVYNVVWSCTGLKQSFIWLIIMLFARGSWQRKLWFIPLGWACAYLFNIVRITLIGLLCAPHPERFEFYHAFLFKYLFYAVLFALWVWWIERVGKVK